MKNKPGPKAWMPTQQSFVDMEAYAARGLTMEQIAGCLGISYDTLNERSKEIPEISQSIKRGQSVGIAEISNALYESAKAGNTTAQIFFMKCRAHWKEINVVENTGKDGAPLASAITVELVKERINEMLNKSSKE